MVGNRDLATWKACISYLKIEHLNPDVPKLLEYCNLFMIKNMVWQNVSTLHSTLYFFMGSFIEILFANFVNFVYISRIRRTMYHFQVNSGVPVVRQLLGSPRTRETRPSVCYICKFSYLNIFINWWYLRKSIKTQRHFDFHVTTVKLTFII